METEDDHDVEVMVNAAAALRAKGNLRAAERLERAIASLRSVRDEEGRPDPRTLAG